jgi:hypothetical protein
MTQAEKEKRIRDLAAVVKQGGAPFGPPINATTGEVVAAYQWAIGELRREIERLR